MRHLADHLMESDEEDEDGAYTVYTHIISIHSHHEDVQGTRLQAENSRFGDY